MFKTIAAATFGWLTPRKGYRPLFMVAGPVSGDALPENSCQVIRPGSRNEVATEAMGVYYLLEAGSHNGNSGTNHTR
jgi:hypothetical protein